MSNTNKQGSDLPTVPDMKLELVPIPVSDVDRAKAFYIQAGFALDHDVSPGNGMRVVQLTPPGSACSIVMGTGMWSIKPGSIEGIHLVVKDIHKTCDILKKRGIEVSGVTDMGGVLYAYFADPDGNGWALQQIAV